MATSRHRAADVQLTRVGGVLAAASLFAAGLFLGALPDHAALAPPALWSVGLAFLAAAAFHAARPRLNPALCPLDVLTLETAFGVTPDAVFALGGARHRLRALPTAVVAERLGVPVVRALDLVGNAQKTFDL